VPVATRPQQVTVPRKMTSDRPL